MIKKLQFCEMCRDQVPDIEDLHFVEDSSDRGFCSEKCILDFYRPYMNFFEEEERAFRSDIAKKSEQGVGEDLYLDITGNQHYLNLALSNPDEIWLFESEITQKFFTHIKEINYSGMSLYYILICSYVEGAPSFIYYKMATKNKELLLRYKRDEEVEVGVADIDSNKAQIKGNEGDISAEILEEIEAKKSQILAQMLEERSAGDIPIEKFHAYDAYLEEVIQEPDEIYENEDDEGDIINTFIKSFKVGETSFFYIAMALQYDTSIENNEVALLPIIGFPSVDNTLYPKYATGKRVNDVLKN